MPTDREDIVEALRTIIDPELYIDIWTLGLIYEITLKEEHTEVDVKMTFTSPACPAGPQLVDQVRQKIEALDGIEQARVQVVFDPPWEPSEDLKAMMGLL
ncbi:MAG: metal-sulfur cluster assembly factor [Bdellovibrionales bacterium]|nr:metal-sulfur cluster assembly factor [Bdellovibrionales bacterium]